MSDAKRRTKLKKRVQRLQRMVNRAEASRRSRARSILLNFLKPRLTSAEAELKKFDAARAKVTGVSQAGVDLVASFEGFSPTWYNDGVGVQTIGYGFTGNEWTGKTITRTQANTVLRKLLNGTYGSAVVRAQDTSGLRLTQNQFDALVSFTYNLGTGWVNNDQWTIWRELKAKNEQGVADAILLYNKGGGQVMLGLKRRREAERRLFLK